MDAEDRNHLEDFSISGIWWLPDDPDIREPGELSFQNERSIVLALNGSFESAPFIDIDHSHTPEIIYGLSNTGEQYTLFQCSRNDNRYSKAGYQTSSYRARYLAIGPHMDSFDSEQLSSVSIRLTGLEWATWHIWSQEEESNYPNRSKVMWTDPDAISFSIPQIASKIRFVYRELLQGIDTPTIVCQQKTFIRLQPAKSVNLDWAIEKVTSLQQLFTLLYGFPCCPVEIHLYDENDRGIDFYYPLQKSKIQQPQSDEMLVPVWHLKPDEVERAFRAWFDLDSAKRLAVTLYCGTLTQPGMYTEFEFVNLVQNLEAFHRAAFPDARYMQPEEYEEYGNEIMNAIPVSFTKAHRDKLKAAITYGYEYSQRKRIKLVLDSLPEPFRKELAKDQAWFIGKIVDTRNRYTHYDPNDKKDVFDPHEMTAVGFALKTVLAFLFLTQLGLEPDKAYGQVKKTDNWRSYSHLMRW